MAEQAGHILISGTIGQVTHYKRRGKWLARKKSSLCKERVLSDPAFKRSRAASSRFGEAATLAGHIYRQFSPELKKHGMIGKLIAKVQRLAGAGYSPSEIKEKLVTNPGHHLNY